MTSDILSQVKKFPISRIGINIVDPCPITESGKEYLLVLFDYFIKWVEAYIVPTIML